MNAPRITPEVARSWSSMEGLPDELGPAVKPAPAGTVRPTGARATGHRALEFVGGLVPGLALAALLAWVAEAGARWLGRDVMGFAKSPVSGVPVAIILGLLVGNLFGLPAAFKAGLRLCGTLLLRTAIVFLGLRLSLGMVGGISWQALPVVLLCIATALFLVPKLGAWAGLPRRLALLIAIGTGICGVTAIVATAPAIKAEDDEVSYAVACVVIFGLTAMLFHPFLAHLIFATDLRSAGIFLGTAIHDTSQVAGAALSFEARYAAPETLNVATVTKLMRNLCLAAAIPIIVVMHVRGGAIRSFRPAAWHTVFPLFVLGFLAMTVVRTVGDASAQPFGLLEPGQWRHLLVLAEQGSTAGITVVMAAIGLQTDFSRFSKLGLRPFLVGFAAALAVGGVSAATLLLGRALMSG